LYFVLWICFGFRVSDFGQTLSGRKQETIMAEGTMTRTPGPGTGQPGRPAAVVDDTVSVMAPPGLVSIVVPCCGQLEFTRLLVPSLLRHSRPPYEVIFLDIGSLDGTAEYLAGLAAGASVPVQIVRTPTDLGIPSACAEALGRAKGQFLVLLNNDTLVTEGWLHQLVSLASMSLAIGMVGPMSNYAAPPQLIETVPYRIGPKRSPQGRVGGITKEPYVETQAVDAFAHKWREEYKGKWIETDRLGGFCLLIKREVLSKIGLPEKESASRNSKPQSSFPKGSTPSSDGLGLELFDTDVLSARARQAGYTLAVCKDLFIHHFGSRTFAHGAPVAPG
jgi:GT2 family glycosyltransferase